MFGTEQIEAAGPSIVHLALLPNHLIQEETLMSPNSKDNKSGQNKPTKDSDPKGTKQADKGSEDNKSTSTSGSKNKGEKKS